MSDQELIALALAREFLERRSERAWRAEVVADWSPLLPVVPKPSEWNRRTRWVWGAFEAHRARWLGSHRHRTPAPPAPQPGARGHLVVGFGCCVALSRWFSGFRLGLRIGWVDGLIRGWTIVPAARPAGLPGAPGRGRRPPGGIQPEAANHFDVRGATLQRGAIGGGRVPHHRERPPRHGGGLTP